MCKKMDEIREALCKVIHPWAADKWLETPNAKFGGLTPTQVVMRGEEEKVWAAIYYLESGQPS